MAFLVSMVSDLGGASTFKGGMREFELHHLTGHQIATLAHKVQSFWQTGAFCTLVEIHFLVIFALQTQSQGLDKGWTFKS